MPTGIPPEAEGRPDPLFPNAWLISKREFGERVKSRLFVVSTLLLAGLAVAVALTPVLIRFVDRGTTTTIAIASNDDGVAQRSIATLGLVLNRSDAGSGKVQPYAFVRVGSPETIADEVGQGRYDAALIANRTPTGGIDFRFITGEGIGPDRIQTLTVAAWGVAILDWSDANRGRITSPFVIPNVDVVAGAGPTIGGQPLAASDYASRRIVGVVFVVLIFITLVIYGMWVAAGVLLYGQRPGFRAIAAAVLRPPG
jgi:hypothetical protein